MGEVPEAADTVVYGPDWPAGYRPSHSLKDEVSEDGMRHKLLKIFCDTPEGRTYEGLTTGEERLAYMRAHHQDSTWHVQPDERVLEDWDEGKRCVVKTLSPEGQALAKLDPPQGEKWEGLECEEHLDYLDFFQMMSTEGRVLTRRAPPGGEEWEDLECEEYLVCLDYFKTNASYVEELRPKDRLLACSTEESGST
ncbi:hypothetical protein RB598_005379 [Gaeumannomyces tritici]